MARGTATTGEGGGVMASGGAMAGKGEGHVRTLHC